MDRTGAQDQDVVIVGASVAGLLTAAALARAGRRVTLLDRDDLPDAPEPRAGVPQGRQPHLLLHRGLRAIEELLPGFGARLRAAGAVPVDTGELAWLSPVGWAPSCPQLGILLATRPLIEHALRESVAPLPGVRVVGGVRVTGLRRGGAGEPRWWVDAVPAGWSDGQEPTPEARGADVVVDASGRATRLPRWLAALEVPEAPVEALDAHVGYSTVRVRVPRGRVVAPGVVILAAPGLTGGLALPAEEDLWTVTGFGAGELRPPRDLPALREFLEGVRDDALARVLAAGEVDGDVAAHRQTGNVRHHYERVGPWPDGLLVVGDALCAFNPVYGQGMTVAAMMAQAVRDADARGPLTAPGAAGRLVRACSRVAEGPWQLATSADRALLGEGPPSNPVARLMGRWIDELERMSKHGDLRAQTTLARMFQLVGSPVSLFHPLLVTAAVRTRVRGYGPLAPRPAILREEVGAPVVDER
ncbi:FAD dependent oxidoreductase [Cellulomonas flavigena DSM 20109]|uniref:FAD dependent oxidoreductase n=1 Tax=Cellulomonas flavigena (strain ATCC 482 / DSM 20109 / BCRC 11376 / JCM 18109 / NBRC 3775 / NCIMB 8073 / NRS 134) TaxID=446466 RepID=D5UI03_CELFN|nr:FAD-dependent monooxygenase [Cellulomonas flavigena]ADG73427.1 FAD dependent oxidoreductase [Cellulomonas flavigena DSM 20109]